MSGLASIDDRLQIKQLQLDYSVTGSQETAWGAQQRLDRLVQRALDRHLQGLFEPLRGAGEGLWFIRRLQFAADIDLELSDREIIQNWSQYLAKALQQEIFNGDSGEVIQFDSYAAYLGQFLVAVAHGGAASRAWYFEHFSSLRSLPAAQAIVTAVLKNPELGLQALHGLRRTDRSRVINALSGRGAQRLLQGFGTAAQSSSGASIDWVPLLTKHLHQLTDTPLLVSDDPWRGSLELYLRISADTPQATGKTLASLVVAVVTLRDFSMLHSRRWFERLAQGLLNGRSAIWFKRLTVEQSQHLQPLLGLPDQAKKQLLDAVQSPASDEQKQFAEPRFTPFGGVFLLLPLLQNLPLEEWLQDWPELENDSKSAVMRILILGQSLGADQLTAVLRDPLIRDLAGISPGLTLSEIQDWLAAIKPAQVVAAQQFFCAWRIQQSSINSVAVEYKPFAQRSLAIVTASEGQYWLLLRGCQEARPNALRQALARLLPDIEPDHNPAGSGQSSLAADLDYLRLPELFRTSGAAGWLLTVLSQNLLRDFSRRVPGFAASSLAHLRDNFLRLSAKLDPEPERWLVKLSRPPLNVVLSMTGMARNQYRLSWLNEQKIELYQGE